MNLILHFLLWIGAMNAEKIWPNNFTDLFWKSSAVSSDGKTLYIDGGEVWNGTASQSLNAFPLQSTLIVDLTESWTIRPSRPKLRGQT